MPVIGGLLTLYTFLVATALLFNAPLVLIVLAVRRRIAPGVARGLLAAGFAAAAIYMIWRMEWFDVWRHGIPSVGYMLTAFGPYTAAVAATGWALGALIVPRARVAPGARLREHSS
jgi:hypothetical protein